MIKKKVFSGITTDFLLTGIKLVKQFFFIPVIIYFLGSESYGEYITIIAYLGFYNLLDFNIDLFLIKELSKRKSEKSNQNLVSIGLVMTILLATLIFSLGIITNYFLVFLNIDFYVKYNFIFILMLFNKIIQVFGGYFTSLLFSLHKMSFLNSVKSILTLVEVFIAFVLLNLDIGIQSLFYSEFLITIFSLIILINYSFRFFKIRIKKINLRLIREAFNYSFSHYLIKISKLGLTNLDSIIIHYFFGANLVTIYTITMKLPVLFSREVAGKVCTNLFSSISSINLNSISSSTSKLLHRLVYLMFRLSFLVSISIYFVNKSFVQIWVGDKLFYGNDLNLVFCLMVLIEIIYFFSETLVLAQGNIKTLGRLSLLELLVNTLLSLVLIKFFGVVGVALASLISKITIPFIYVSVELKRIYKIQYPNASLYFNIFNSFFLTLMFYQIFNSLNNYFIVIFGFLVPFIFNLISEDFKILSNKKINLFDKIRLIIYGKDFIKDS